MLVLGYVRVSSVEQEQGFGPDVQADAIRAHASSVDLPEPELVYESISGESLAARVELRHILRRAQEAQEQGIEAHVILYRLDRLARNLADQEIVVGFAMKHGFRLHSTYSAESDTLNPAYAGDPMRVLIRQIFGAFAQLERTTIQGRLDSGLAAKAKVGGSTGGRPPFGYISRDTDLIIDPEAAPIVIRVFELASNGLDQASIAGICAREFPFRCSGWGKWNIARMLKRRRLYGHGLYRSRAGVTEVSRPELRILPESSRRAVTPTISGEVAWTRFSDPIPATTVCLLVDRPLAWVQKRVSEQGFSVTWIKGRLMMARDDARLLERIAVREAGSKVGA